jgi:hypothetical protein
VPGKRGALQDRRNMRETPEFQCQSRGFAAAVKASGKPVPLLVGEGYNHFEIPETLAGSGRVP